MNEDFKLELAVHEQKLISMLTELNDSIKNQNNAGIPCELYGPKFKTGLYNLIDAEIKEHKI